MNYKRIYDRIIENRKQNLIERYVEKHHIIPRSLGGSNEKDNLVKLTAREHFICHYLLAKIYQKDTFEWYKMNHAFMMMKCNSLSQQRYFNSRLYDALKSSRSTLMSIAQSGKNNSNYGKLWICNIQLKESKLIKNSDKIPEGWVKGRNIWKIKEKQRICKRCGSLSCIHLDVCKSKLLNTFITHLSFDKKVLGTEKYYNEYYRVVNLLKDDYIIKKLSIEDIKNKYNFNTNESVRCIFKRLNIPLRSLKEAAINFQNKK